ncbi:hypothetical protein TNCV_3939001 [Trichonephila clavipes]|nr:hypothetical protein TNCV_3939001 [Trichonephila clavipes]
MHKYAALSILSAIERSMPGMSILNDDGSPAISVPIFRVFTNSELLIKRSVLLVCEEEHQLVATLGDFHGLRTKLYLTLSITSSDRLGQPLPLFLRQQPVFLIDDTIAECSRWLMSLFRRDF